MPAVHFVIHDPSNRLPAQLRQVSRGLPAEVAAVGDTPSLERAMRAAPFPIAILAESVLHDEALQRIDMVRQRTAAVVLVARQWDWVERLESWDHGVDLVVPPYYPESSWRRLLEGLVQRVTELQRQTT